MKDAVRQTDRSAVYIVVCRHCLQSRRAIPFNRSYDVPSAFWYRVGELCVRIV
jgi:hypothetical protein